jgi:hypothetical protein
MKTTFKFAVLLFAVFLFSNCTSRSQRFREYLASMANVLTYDQAIMNWGTPILLTEGDKVFAAVWGAEYVGAVAMPVGKMVMAVPMKSG